VLIDLAVAIADGAETISDLAVLAVQPALFGSVTSDRVLAAARRARQTATRGPGGRSGRGPGKAALRGEGHRGGAEFLSVIGQRVVMHIPC
jgi:hypothetical protein